MTDSERLVQAVQLLKEVQIVRKRSGSYGIWRKIDSFLAELNGEHPFVMVTLVTTRGVRHERI